MRHHRYQQPKADPRHETLPLDTVVTILTRQSTTGQFLRSPQSVESKPEVLVALARHLGYQHDHICVDNSDMGVSAYDTLFEERQGLSNWLFESLPSRKSRVLMVSMPDRLSRDRWQIQPNVIIQQMAKHGGWLICGTSARDVVVYNFQLEKDCETFRDECSDAKRFIEQHVKKRLHPAVQRAAMAGQYVGGFIPWGYSVDYDPHSPSYKHFTLYRPHALLATEHVFRFFLNLQRPSVVEIERHWRREGLFWPAFEQSTDPRVVHVINSRAKFRSDLDGYLFNWRQAQGILTNVTYLGWKVRSGEIAMGDTQAVPMICHPPLVDPDLFWDCYDQLLDERPVWAPPRLAVSRPLQKPRQPYGGSPNEIRFLGHGRIRCATHGTYLRVVKEARAEHPHLVCGGEAHQDVLEPLHCLRVRTQEVEQALGKSFLSHLTLDEFDVAELARLAQQRANVETKNESQLRREVADNQIMLRRVMQQALRQDNALIVDELYEQARQIKRAIMKQEEDLTALKQVKPVSSQALEMAHRADSLARRIRTTFQDWSRQAQARVLTLAINDSTLGYVSRYALGLWVDWYGGRQSRIEFLGYGKVVRWTLEEDETLLQYYPILSWKALLQVFPGRSAEAIRSRGKDTLKLTRPTDGGINIVPIVIAPTKVPNTMESYGFPLAVAENGGLVLSNAAS